MVSIYYTYFDQPEETAFNDFLNLLPPEEQLKNTQYKHWEDRLRHLFSRLLLIHATHALGISDTLFPLKRHTNGKPYSDHLYFNISHSGNFVAVAISNVTELGLDIQKISDVPIEGVSFFLTAMESANILSSPNYLKSTADFWSMKEAIAKANGKGILLPFLKIHIEKDKGFVEGKEWFLKEILLSPDYACWLATSIAIATPECHFIDYI